MLFIYTICHAYWFAFACAWLPSVIALSAAGLTVLVTIALTVYACVTTNFRLGFGSIVILFFPILFIALSGTGFGLDMHFDAFWHTLVIALIVICYGFYLFYDTLLLALDYRHKLDADEYVIGALYPFLDIMMPIALLIVALKPEESATRD